MFEFANIWAFALFPIPFILHWLIPPYKQRREALRFPLFHSAVKVSKQRASTGAWVSRRHFFQWLMLTMTWVCLLVSFASPQIVGEPEMKVKTARNFVIAADISFSMANTDWKIDGEKVSRWEGVKEVLSTFVEQREGDRLSLVFFGSNAYLQAPLTTDHEVIKYMLNETQVGMAGQMTSLGKAIGYSLKIFEGDSLDQKVLLQLTDGQDDGRGMFPSDAARLAQKDSVTIYTIGIGESTGNNAGLDEGALQEIADITGGQYFLAKDKKQLKEAYEVLNTLEPIEFEEEDYVPTTLLYHYPLGLAIVLAFLLALSRGIGQLFGRLSKRY